MKRKRAEGAKMHSTPLVRASISFPPDLYESLEEIATQKKVSLAWVVRDAAEKYVANETGKDGEGQTRSAALTGKLTRGSR
jgi:metal-responsive CopG/Arc/MetJ family transcriptional regulator